MSLFDDSTKLLVAGDHVVGLGSALLDPRGGGDMTEYLQTCRNMIELESRIICPAHGVPQFRTHELLTKYIEHREVREQAILSAFRAISDSLDAGSYPSLAQLVQAVYTDVPEKLWPLATQNVWLHLRKLQTQGDIPDNAVPRL
jgi:glyoxylase-like metal-dependent hydrolase (beta-lactamase superfamily II)